MKRNLYGIDSKSTIYVATPFSSRTHDFVDSSIFIKPSRLDLSHGSNLLEPPHRLQEAIAKASIWGLTMAQYDSPFGPSSLRELIAEYESTISEEKISLDNILITLGGTDGLALYFQCRASEIITEPTALLIGPQYPTIARIAEAAGFTVAMTQCSSIEFKLPETAMLEWRPNTVVLTQPSNPFGTFVSNDDFASLCAACASIEADIVVDRVCGDVSSPYYHPSPKYRTIAKENGIRITEIESYSKRRGIPGLRIGYNIMSPEDVHWCANAVTGRTITSIGCAAVECDTMAFLDKDEEYITHIANNHAIVNRNVCTLRDVLGSKLINCSNPTNGANFLASVLLPRSMLESSAAFWLHSAYQLGTYPVSCFELWPELDETDVMRIRITAATPPEEFDKAVSVLLSALSEGDS